MHNDKEEFQNNYVEQEKPGFFFFKILFIYF